MRKSIWIGMVILIFTALTAASSWAADAKDTASGMKAFETSWQADQYVLAFFYSEMNDAVKEKKAGFETIAAGLKDKADAHFVDIKDPNQSDVVNLYRLDRAPMPLVLVVAPNGAITGGFPRDFTEENIANAIVGPLTTQCLKALQDGKLVFVSVPGDTEEANAAAMKGVTDFKNDARYSQLTEVVSFKNAGPSDQRMMKSLGVDDKNSAEPVTAFLAPPGALIRKFTGKTNKDVLVSALMSKMKGGGGCCGGGSSGASGGGSGKSCK